MMKSLGAAVRISKGSPPASRTASFTTLAMPSRWLKQIASSDELLTTAILGLSMSASLNPSAFHCARRTASRGDPGSKLLLNALGISVVISHEMPFTTPLMNLTRQEQEMLDGRKGRATQKAMELLVRYAEALGAERFVDTRNVAGVPGSANPFLQNYYKDKGAEGLDAIFSHFDLDSDELVEVPNARSCRHFTCRAAPIPAAGRRSA